MPMMKLVLIGNAGGDPEIRTTASGIKQAQVSVAVNSRTKDRSTGEMVDMTDWWKMIFFDKLAGIAEQYVRKGSQVYIEGRPRVREWEDREGKVRIEREVIVDQLQLLGGRPQEPVRAAAQAKERMNAPKQAAEPEFNDDIPY